MILVGSQRGGGADLARHLMKDENERVEIHSMRGFVSRDLHGAFQESHAVSRGTRCKQHLYSLSFNPPPDARPDDAVFIDAVDRAEERLGLSGQPRAIVFHEKRGFDGQVRRHAHAVWCRIDVETMTAKQISFDHEKLNALGRDLYIEHGWTMPRGFVNRHEANPRNYSLAEWQQAKRAKIHPAKLKGMFQDCWAISDSQTSFAHALKEHGYILARGDRRGIVAVDRQGEVYAIPRYVGIKTKQVRARISDESALPDTQAAHAQAKALTTDRLRELHNEQRRAAHKALSRFAEQRRRAIELQREHVQRQLTAQRSRQQIEQQERQARLRTGWRRLLDRITGQRRKVEAENRTALQNALTRDRSERQTLAEMHRDMRQRILQKTSEAKARHQTTLRELSKDIKRLEAIPPPKVEKKTKAETRDAYVAEQRTVAAAKAKRRRTPTKDRPRRRSRGRDGPAPGL